MRTLTEPGDWVDARVGKTPEVYIQWHSAEMRRTSLNPRLLLWPILGPQVVGRAVVYHHGRTDSNAIATRHETA